MKGLLATTALAVVAITVVALTGTAAHAVELSPKAEAKLAALNKIRWSQRIETPAAKAAIKKATEFLVEPAVTGRSCDTEDEANPTCEMEDGTAISVEAVPVKLPQAEATAKCASHHVFSNDPKAPDGIRITMRDVSKVEMKAAEAKFKLLWCTFAAQDWSARAAKNRVEGRFYDNAPAPAPEAAEIKITNGKLTQSYGSVRQAITVKNNTSSAEPLAIIECGFFFKGELVGTGMGAIGNLMPGMTKYTTVSGLDIDKADKVECSVK